MFFEWVGVKPSAEKHEPPASFAILYGILSSGLKVISRRKFGKVNLIMEMGILRKIE